MTLLHILAFISIGTIHLTQATSTNNAAKLYRPVARQAYAYHVAARQDSDGTEPSAAEEDPPLLATTTSSDSEASVELSTPLPDVDITTSSEDSTPPDTTPPPDSDVTTSSDDSFTTTTSSVPPAVTNDQFGSCEKGPVAACGPKDLTPANWVNFGIDDFLKQFIANNSISDNFPKFLVEQSTSTKFNFDCSSLSSTNCKFPTAPEPANAKDCRFVTLHNTICDGYTDPHVGFLVANYINLFNYQNNVLGAIDDADKAITSGNVIQNLVNALAPQKQDVGFAVFKLIADLVLDIIPIGGEIKAGVNVARAVGKRVGKIAKGINKDSDAIEDIAANNAAIDQKKQVTLDGLKQQYTKVIAAAKKNIMAQSAAVFGAKSDPEKPSDPATSNVFQLAYSGMWLNEFPDRTSLNKQIQLTIKLWLASRIMVSMGYAIGIDTTPLAGDPETQRIVCAARPTLGFRFMNGCASFKITPSKDLNDVLHGRDPVDLKALTSLINANDVLGNAVDCSGKKKNADQVDFQGFLDLGSKAVIPECMFGIPVAQGKA